MRAGQGGTRCSGYASRTPTEAATYSAQYSTEGTTQAVN
jgi:hypothetical protein